MFTSTSLERTELVSEGNNLLVGFVGGIEEGSMANIVPEIEVDFTKVGGHEVLELLAVDMMVHVAVENKIWKSVLDLQQSSLVLGVGDRPGTDVRVLPSDGAHPSVLDTLVELIPKGNTRLDECFGSGTEICERRIEQPWYKVQNPLRGDRG